jgi:hypothetical protein
MVLQKLKSLEDEAAKLTQDLESKALSLHLCRPAGCIISEFYGCAPVLV